MFKPSRSRLLYQTGETTDENLHSSHVGPPYPGRQWHQILPPRYSHVPPWWQGRSAHVGRASAEQSRTDELSITSLMRSTGRPFTTNCTATSQISFFSSSKLLRRWLQLQFDSDSTAVRLPFDCSSSALRPFDDLRYYRVVALRLEMHDEICTLKYLKISWKVWNISRPLFEIFHETFNFQY